MTRFAEHVKQEQLEEFLSESRKLSAIEQAELVVLYDMAKEKDASVSFEAVLKYVLHGVMGGCSFKEAIDGTKTQLKTGNIKWLGSGFNKKYIKQEQVVELGLMSREMLQKLQKKPTADNLVKLLNG